MKDQLGFLHVGSSCAIEKHGRNVQDDEERICEIAEADCDVEGTERTYDCVKEER